MERLRKRDRPAVKWCGLLLLLSVLAVAWLIFDLASELSLVRRSTYATGEQARELIGLGWLPSWFPAGATDIRHAHDLDTNLSQTRFSLPHKDFEKLGTV